MYTKSFHSCVSRAFCQSTGYGGTIKEGHDVDKVTCAQYQWSQGAPQGPDHGEEGGEASHHQVHRGHRRPDEVILVCDLDQGCPEPGKQGTNESEQIRTNPGEFGQNQTNRAKNGHFSAKTGQNGQKKKTEAKPGQKRANKTKPWRNRTKPKVLPNLGSLLCILDLDVMGEIGVYA